MEYTLSVLPFNKNPLVGILHSMFEERTVVFLPGYLEEGFSYVSET